MFIFVVISWTYRGVILKFSLEPKKEDSGYQENYRMKIWYVFSPLIYKYTLKKIYIFLSNFLF